jgi:hypothetical protein
MAKILPLPTVLVLWFIKNISYGQQLNTAQLMCVVVHNEQERGTDDIEVKTAVKFQQIAVEVLKELACWNELSLVHERIHDDGQIS